MKRTTRLKEPQVPEIGDLINFDELGSRPKYAGVEMTSETNIPSVSAETQARQAADQEIWTEINAIEASSDVVDVVGTYAELEAYDTSKLHDKDLIKVLQDETHDDAITYYRYSSSTEAFTYVGAEGPYYTTSETDVLLGGKQDKLIAGSNIQIAADGKTISATDTTYSAFTGATSFADGTSGLVPAPTTTDVDKYLKGDGTWGTVSTAANTIFYMNASESGGTRHIYKNPDMTGAATSQEVFDANDQGQVILRISTSATPDMYSDCYLQNAYKATGDYQLLFLDEKTYRSFDTTTLSADTFTYSARVLQDQLTAGTNIQINGKVISATDTTYSAFTGTDGQTAGAAGLVPAPATTDDGKYLNADGSWQAVPTYSTFSGATSQDSGAAGLVPAPMAGEQDKYLKANGLWSTISVSLPIASSVDLGGIKVGTNLSIDGTTGVLSAVDTTYSAFTGATSSVAGAAGLVPAPAAGDDDKYLKGDGTWGTVSGGTTSDFTGATSSTAGVHGLVPAPAAGDDVKYLKGDGSWATITANNISSNDWSGLWQ